LINVIHLFNPSKIVVGGSTATFPGYMETALKTAEEFTIPEMFDSCKITTPRDEKRIIALGAIEYMKSVLW
jgi:glucokinase